jgi:hypothetical protein
MADGKTKYTNTCEILVRSMVATIIGLRRIKFRDIGIHYTVDKVHWFEKNHKKPSI